MEPAHFGKLTSITITHIDPMTNRNTSGKIQIQLIKELANGQFHTTENLFQRLQLTQTQLWQIIQQLDQTGIDIEFSIGRGYRLATCIEFLDERLILNQLQSDALSQLDQLILHEEIESTNDYLLKSGSLQTVACFAEQQTHGKGQHGRTWISPFGRNIYHSLLWHFSNSTTSMVGLSQAIAVIIARVLRQYGVKQGIYLKWPNDIYHGNQKLAGVLLETTTKATGACEAVIGIGINVYLSPSQALPIQQPWTCLETITGKSVERNRLAGLLLNELLLSLPQFSLYGLVPFLQEWQDLDYLYQKTITLTHAQHTFMGIMQGISSRGELILLDSHQQQHTFLNGSVRLTSFRTS